jgi:hypothetical protein
MKNKERKTVRMTTVQCRVVCQSVLQGLPHKIEFFYTDTALEKVENTNICNKIIIITVLIFSEKHLKIMGLTMYILDDDQISRGI